MSKKPFGIATLLCLCLSVSAAASSDPSDSAGLRHLFFSFGGLFLLDFDKSQKLINETSDGEHIVMDDYRSGFRLLQNVNAGLGVEVPLNYWVPGGVTVGLDLLAGKNASFDRFVQTRDEVAALGAPRIPKRAADLSVWSTGDNVLFLARGGIGFSAGMGFTPVAGAAAYYFAEGDWYLYIEKTENNHVYLKVTSTKVHSLGVLANSIIVGLGADLFKETDKGFSYSYDLNDANARLAYEDALHGSLGPSDRMAASSEGHVARVLTSKVASTGGMRNWYFGIPLLDVVGGRRGKVYSFDNTYNHEDGSRSMVTSGIYVDHKYSAGWLSDHAVYINDFFGNYVTHVSTSGETSTGYQGEYFWAFESSKTSAREVRKELASLAAKTGLRSILSIDLPKKKHLGYLNMKLSAELLQKATDALMDWASATPHAMVAMLTDSGQGRIENYFSANADTNRLCGNSGGDLGVGKSEC